MFPDRYASARSADLGVNCAIGGPVQSRQYDECAKSVDPAGAYRRPGVAERVERAIAEGEVAMQRWQAAQEARSIINQHPEFARLLDLLEWF